MPDHFGYVYVKAVYQGQDGQRAGYPEERLAGACEREKIDRDDSDPVEQVERDTENNQDLEPVELLRHPDRLVIFLGAIQERQAIQDYVGNKVHREQDSGQPVKPERGLTFVSVENEIFNPIHADKIPISQTEPERGRRTRTKPRRTQRVPTRLSDGFLMMD